MGEIVNNEIEKSEDKGKDIVKLHRNQFELLMKEREQLIKERDELKEIVNHSMEMFGLVKKLMGGTIPNTLVGGLKAVNMFFKTASSGDLPKEQIMLHIEALKKLAPNHLSESQIKQLSDGQH